MNMPSPRRTAVRTAPTLDDVVVPAPASGGFSASRGRSGGSRPFITHRGSPIHLSLIGVGAVIAIAVTLWGASLGQFNQGQLTRVIIYAIAIAGLNIATGYTGLVSVGHSAFFGLGAYTTAILVAHDHWRPEYTIPAAVVVCFVVGVIVGLPALRIRGLYLAIATLAFGVAFPEIVDRFASLTGGSAGIDISFKALRPPKWTGYTLFEETHWLYWLSIAMLVLVMVVVHNIVRSRYGLAMMASRDNEIAASASGINLAFIKTFSFGVSGALAGIGGCLFAMYLGSLNADSSFTLLNAIALLTGLIIGGESTRFGPILGGLTVVYIPYYTSSIGQGESSAVLFGAVLIAIIFIAPEGITGAALRFIRKVFVVVPAIPRPYKPEARAATGGAGRSLVDAPEQA